MKIKHFIPCSYTDFPGNVACVIVLGDAVNLKAYWNDRRVIKHMVQNKHLLDGVVIRGGRSSASSSSGDLGNDPANDPTLTPSVYAFCKKVKAMGFSVKVDTNGFGPELLKRLMDDGLVDYVSMELKAPPEKYLKLTGTAFSRVKEAYRLVRGFKAHEFKTEINVQLAYEDVSQIAEMTDKHDYFLYPSVEILEASDISYWSRALGVRYRI